MQQFTSGVAGAIPPFSFHPEFTLIAAPYLFQRYEEIAFNAGTLERSIMQNVDDYRRIAAAKATEFYSLLASSTSPLNPLTHISLGGVRRITAGSRVTLAESVLIVESHFANFSSNWQ
ncbi:MULTISPECIES: hypothetical protein [Shewanella]|uniref:Uncharacterized protein n=1 Tax=Shewanella fodinae TaxID=552357 RepID=A0A4R2FK17_9GAMM|nr:MULTISPECIES: hypothetical protein [Shewanella]MBO1273005.1 hypothetical protein [Shewanella sp. 4t3-1-2LB]TCN83086.1 hypothetical protein EDC91_11666 [Shewanella fodinae]